MTGTVLGTLLISIVALLGHGVARAAEARGDAMDHWPQWRGPLGTGAAPRGEPPVEWGEGRNVRWGVALPGLGHSTPVVWGERVFLTSAVEAGVAEGSPEPMAPGAHDNLAPAQVLDFVVLAVDRRSGEIAWRRTVRSERPHEGTHATGSWASASPVTDGERVFAFFGSRGLYALDLDGAPLWERDLGDMETFHGHGEGSSPALWGDTLIVNWDHQGDSFLVALDKRSGEERWRAGRDEITSWSSPLVVEHQGRPQVVVGATRRVRSYDLADGRLLWESAGLSRNVVASPVAGDGLVHVASSYDFQAMLAIRLAAASGEVTGTEAVAWRRDRDTPYVPSPVLADGTLCFLKHLSGILTCVEAATGRTLSGPRRLPEVDRVFASPVAAAGRLYVAGRNGATAVVELGGEFEVLAVNRLDDSFSASPAVAGRELLLRGQRYLYSLAEKASSP